MINNLEEQLGTWYPAVSHLFDEEWMQNLGCHLGQDIDKLCPPLDKIFRAFTLTPMEKVKVVIVGQDPYPAKGVADGLAFSSGNGTLPYSLKVIFEKLEDLYGEMRFETSLDDWAAQGVLLINPVLSTRDAEVHAHENIGWQKFTSTALEAIPQKVIWVAWGSPAMEFVYSLEAPKFSTILNSRHPAAMRHGYRFRGCFQDINNILIDNNQSPIKWV